MIAEEPLERRGITRHDGLFSAPPHCRRRVLAEQALDVPDEFRPALEPVLSRNDELRLRERQSRSRTLVFAHSAHCIGITDSGGFEQVLGLLLVLLEVRLRGELARG